MQSSALIKETTKLSEAIKEGDLEAARAAYAAARLPYKRIESVSGRIADLENRIDGLADYLEKREDDPAFAGFHRIEYGLYTKASTEGLAPVADALLGDVTTLNDRLKEIKLAPEDMVEGALRQARRLAEDAVPRGENRYSQIEAPEFAANLEGIAKSVTLMIPLVEAASADTAKALKGVIAHTQTKIDALGSSSYADVPKSARDDLAASFADLATRIETIKSVLGLE
jgi:iron uptake system component EfeO